MDEQVILVDEQDQEVGTEEKIKAHREGRLHRAFSVFIFNPAGEMLLQKRSRRKYHSGGLWTNTCCSHPRPGEAVEDAAKRKLRQEMGIRCRLQKAFTFLYKAPFENGLTEHELDHVFIGQYSGKVEPNPEEAEGWVWADPKEIAKDLKLNPQRYSAWFRLAFERVIAHRKGD